MSDYNPHWDVGFIFGALNALKTGSSEDVCGLIDIVLGKVDDLEDHITELECKPYIGYIAPENSRNGLTITDDGHIYKALSDMQDDGR